MSGTNSIEPHLLETVACFLKAHCDFTQPILLALSGGPDSLALLLLLRQLQQQLPFRFAIAHVDHGWRLESKEEARQLQQLAAQWQIPFHLRQLDPRTLSGNLEAASRIERLRFFRELSQREGYQAVLLGHHADDQAETVLKRVLEGNSVSRLGGLRTVTEIEGVRLWRPFLAISKETLAAWVGHQQIEPFEDRTNLDPRFLRGRFRTQIIPLLAEKFGKEIANGLCHIGQESQELGAFLEEILSPYLSKIERGHLGEYLDLSTEMPPQRFAIKFLVKSLCSLEHTTFPRSLVERAVNLLQHNNANKQLLWENRPLYIDRKRLLLFKPNLPPLPPRQPIPLGTTQYGPWQIHVSQQHHPLHTGWQQLWKGHLSCLLPASGEYEIGPPVLSAPYPGEHSPLRKWWANEKIPACLRPYAPVIWKNNRIHYEFLTRRPPVTHFQEPYLSITLCTV